MIEKDRDINCPCTISTEHGGMQSSAETRGVAISPTSLGNSFLSRSAVVCAFRVISTPVTKGMDASCSRRMLRFQESWCRKIQGFVVVIVVNRIWYEAVDDNLIGHRTWIRNVPIGDLEAIEAGRGAPLIKSNPTEEVLLQTS